MNKKREAKESYMTRSCTFTMRSLACVGWPVKYKRFNKGQVFLDQPEQVRSNTTVNFPHTGMVE